MVSARKVLKNPSAGKTIQRLWKVYLAYSISKLIA
jgi:hypothetical protein